MKTHLTTSFHHSVSTIQVLIIFLLLNLPVAAQEVGPEVRQLTVGAKTERTVGGEEAVHIYAVELKRGQVLRVSVQEKGVDVTAFSMRALDQQKASAASNFSSGFMQESLTLIADRDGTYWLVFTALRMTPANIEGKYEFSTALKDASSQVDIQRVKAETLMEEGARLLDNPDKRSSALAVTKFEESLKIWNLLADSYWAEMAKASLASAFLGAGDFAKAESYMKQVLRSFENAKNEAGIAAISISLVGLYTLSHNEKAARQHFNRAIEISRRLGDKRAESLLGLLDTSTLTNRSNNQVFAQDLAQARAKDDKPAEASLWAKELFHYLIEGDSIADEEQRVFFEKAEREALPLVRLIKNRYFELNILLGLGVGFYDLTLRPDTDEAADLANKEKSKKYISQALVLARVQNNSLGQSRAYDHLNLVYDGDNDGLAIFFGKKAINSLRDLKQDLKLFSKQAQQDMARQLDEDIYSSLASDLFFEGRLAEAHQVLNLGRDQEFFDVNLNRPQELATLSLTSRELENEQLFNRALENIAAKYSKLADDADYQLAGEELKETLGKLEQNFSAPPSTRDVAANVADTADMQFALRQLTSKAGKKHAAIYVVADIGQVLLITPDGIFAFASSLKAEDVSIHVNSFDMDKYILDFLHTLRSPSLDPRPLAAQIYNKVFNTKELVNGDFTQTTLEDKLTRLKPDVLLWSLSGNIRYVPVAALYDANKRQYLVEKYENAVFTRARKERFLIEPRVWQRGVGFGTSLAYSGLSELPYVPSEISKILGNSLTGQKGFFTGEVFLDRAFTLQAMLASLRTKPDLVHIASHFIFQPGDSQKSFLLLGDGSTLSLGEIQQIPNLFGEVDLLTLSACETGGQQSGADGKEVDGFAEVAQRLGASSVIATLWRIADDGTSKFMTEFYRLRQANPTAPKSEILRQAQLSLLKGKSTTVNGGRTRGADIVGLKESLTGIPFKPRDESPFEHPYYWASFVLFGSSR